MQQHIFWRVTTAFTPALRRRCPRCGHEVFRSSGLFRLNANGARIDVWLVYRCGRCENSYNLPVYGRVTPGELARRGVYEGLLANDGALARQTACDRELLRRHGLRPLWAEAGYTVDGPLPVGDGTQGYRVTITLDKGLRLRTDAVLARKLQASRAWVQRAVKNREITEVGGTPCPKFLVDETTLVVNTTYKPTGP